MMRGVRNIRMYFARGENDRNAWTRRAGCVQITNHKPSRSARPRTARRQRVTKAHAGADRMPVMGESRGLMESWMGGWNAGPISRQVGVRVPDRRETVAL